MSSIIRERHGVILRITTPGIGGGVVNKRGGGNGRDGSGRTFLTRDHRVDGMREFFHMLEGRYGNLSDLFDRGPSGETIVSSTSYGDGILRTEDLARLFRHEATALHVPNFYHRGSASRLGEELIRESSSCSSPSWRGGRNWKVSTSRGLESSDVYTLGEHMPYNVAVASSASAIAAGRDIDDDDGGRVARRLRRR